MLGGGDAGLGVCITALSVLRCVPGYDDPGALGASIWVTIGSILGHGLGAEGREGLLVMGRQGKRGRPWAGVLSGA